ncbi:MAG: DUF4372 domain-containing protein [Candidatus Adiutrix sp.]
MSHQTEKSAKGFSSWDQFVSLMFAQLAGVKSLREIAWGLASASASAMAMGKCVHLGLKKMPNCQPPIFRSTRKWRLSGFRGSHAPIELGAVVLYRSPIIGPFTSEDFW